MSGEVSTLFTQESAADSGAGQHSQIPRGRVQTHGTRQDGGLNHVMQQELAGRSPQHAGEAVDDQQYAGVPLFQRVGYKQHAPGERNHDEQEHAELDDPTWVEAIGQGA